MKEKQETKVGATPGAGRGRGKALQESQSEMLPKVDAFIEDTAKNTKGKKTLMDLRLEFFVQELERSVRFYTQVLGFQVRQLGVGGYTMLTNDTATISLNLRTSLSNDHPVQCRPGEKVGRGVEVVLSVEDINACYGAVEASGWPLSSDLTTQPWGLTDFRLVDPDGYYIRVTSQATPASAERTLESP